MTQPQKSRRQMLEEFLAASPNDAFARYGLALECASSGEHETAIQQFRQLLATHPGYVGAYFQLGQLLARLARKDEAKAILSAGIAVAQQAGESHARDEMQAALMALE